MNTHVPWMHQSRREGGGSDGSWGSVDSRWHKLPGLNHRIVEKKSGVTETCSEIAAFPSIAKRTMFLWQKFANTCFKKALRDSVIVAESQPTPATLRPSGWGSLQYSSVITGTLVTTVNSANTIKTVKLWDISWFLYFLSQISHTDKVWDISWFINEQCEK